jgi:uncharacterized 2Fe-2S/4Fe-4S cluster protein (DUF4445 family)
VYVLDIGTTTLALALVSKEDKHIVKLQTRANPQRIYGADIMSRIAYCQKHGVAKLHQVLLDAINEMITQIDAPMQECLYVCGNATVLHLFWGVDPTSMGRAPYTPAFLEQREENATRLGLRGVERIVSLPSVCAFVGADIVAGVGYVGMSKEKGYRLLIDLGTNAEIVLFSAERSLCTAAAAGPCFEGTNIRCGMSATEGAIYAYGKEGAKTVGDIAPKGICGTGLIDIVAMLREQEIIDETGRMECGRFNLGNGVFLEDADVRQLQLAKSAVCAAILTLLSIAEISFHDVEAVYLSGGFSAEINLKNAAKIGLIPEALASKAIAISNSSLLGGVHYACTLQLPSAFLENVQYIDLSQKPVFSELFIENMFL